MRSPLSICAYLEEEDKCSAVKESGIGDLRREACINESKDSCCHFCSIEDCEIRCDLPAQQENQENRRGARPIATRRLDSSRECGNCTYYLGVECPRAYKRDTELWRRQSPCNAFQLARERRATHTRIRDHSKSKTFQEQLFEYKEELSRTRESHEEMEKIFKDLQEKLMGYGEELNKTYKNHEKLEETLKDLREQSRSKDKIILDLGKQLKTQEAKVRRTAEDQGIRKNKPVPAAQLEPNVGDQAVYDYIVNHSGTISLEKAAQDLQIPICELRSTIERLKRTGRIAQG